MWNEKYFALIRQEMPEKFKGITDVDDFVHRLALLFLGLIGKDIAYAPFGGEPINEDRNTVAYCEKAYKLGFSAIVNDGKLLGFRKE